MLTGIFWENLHRNSDNKISDNKISDWYVLIFKQMIEIPLIISSGENTWSIEETIKALPASNHEEADTRLTFNESRVIK